MKLFKPQKLVIAYFLLALISSQFLLAQHSATHLDSDNHSQHDEDDSESDICQFCVTAKNLEQEFLVQSHVSLSASTSKQNSLCVFEYTLHSTCNKPFHSQAPPTLFS
ncbi:MAG: hypothetical protein GKR92_03610 [Gammaproteobacteria bacterium]|nr:MAG: hypothetical protein GKR92_03610 [Gammaproteobacteria bacterium]